MSEPGEIDLSAPVAADTILEVRSGKMKNLQGLSILSGIDKTLCSGSVAVTAEGIVGDEHDYTFHGGVDKAVHAYCCTHYPTWQGEFPGAASRFRPGGFGENLVVARMNERNVCIGDVVAVGPGGADDDEGLLLQVSLPRQPCFKLNHRFGLRNFAPNTWRTSRTGWYYRVLRDGQVRAGDQLRLLRRPHPEWTIERIQEYLHRTPDDMARVRELAAIDEFGAECRNAFRGRIAKAKARELRAALEAEDKGQWREFRLASKTQQTPRIAAFVFEAVTPLADLEDLNPGAHVKLRLGNGLVRAYSVVGGDRNRFELGVALAEASRGASHFLHNELRPGGTLHVGRFTSAVPMAASASHHEFVAGGVGLTAFLSLVEGLAAIHYSVVLHYAVRSAADVPFRDRVDRLRAAGVVRLYDKAQGQRLDVGRVVRGLPWNGRIGFCGPRRMMDEAARETAAAGLGGDDVHFEAFEADASGDPFDVVVANRGGRRLAVGGEETLLEVLRRQFGDDDVPSSCEVGNCGTCKIAVKDGRIEHRGTALTDEEKARSMLSCVSRGVGSITVEL